MSLLSNIFLFGAGIILISTLTGKGINLPSVRAYEPREFQLNPAITEGFSWLQRAPELIQGAEQTASQAAGILQSAQNEIDKLRGWARRVAQGY
jgi:hypothetical protein